MTKMIRLRVGDKSHKLLKAICIENGVSVPVMMDHMLETFLNGKVEFSLKFIPSPKKGKKASR